LTAGVTARAAEEAAFIEGRAVQTHLLRVRVRAGVGVRVRVRAGFGVRVRVGVEVRVSATPLPSQ